MNLNVTGKDIKIADQEKSSSCLDKSLRLNAQLSLTDSQCSASTTSQAARMQMLGTASPDNH
jgi:hypothetical protein